MDAKKNHVLNLNATNRNQGENPEIEGKNKRRKVSRGDLLKVTLRSFFIQNLWNFERMQAYGFLYCMIPVINRLYPDREGRASACKRHLEAFNTHPYLAPFILGVAIAREERYARGDEDDSSQVAFFKNCMMGPVAGIGDEFFWASLRPFLMILGISLAILAWDHAAIGLWGVLGVLTIYNIIHLFVRWAALRSGYHEDVKIIGRLRNFTHLRLTKVFRISSYLLVGVVAAFRIGRFAGGGEEVLKVVLLLLPLLLVLTPRIKMTSAKVVALVTLLSLAAAYWGWTLSF